MPRGGRRSGSGRKGIGVSKTISLTLPEAIWNEIDQSGKSPSEFIRERLIENYCINHTMPTRLEVDDVWEIEKEKYTEEDTIMAEVKSAIYKAMFREKDHIAILETRISFICPFTGKRFSSIQNLIRKAIPVLINSVKNKRAKKTERLEYEKAVQKSKEVQKKLYEEGKIPKHWV